MLIAMKLTLCFTPIQYSANILTFPKCSIWIVQVDEFIHMVRKMKCGMKNKTANNLLPIASYPVKWELSVFRVIEEKTINYYCHSSTLRIASIDPYSFLPPCSRVVVFEAKYRAELIVIGRGREPSRGWNWCNCSWSCVSTHRTARLK